MMIGTNNTVTMAYNALNANTKAIEKTARALSTGLRMATAADDAAGFAMGQNISAQIAGVDRAVRNSQDGISMLQTAETALNQINSMLQRVRELCVQAANDTLTTQDRSYIQLEIGELRSSINSVACNTTFNNKRLLDGSSAAVWSSNDAATQLKISGSVTEIDQFGQKKGIEGNYKIQIRSKTGSTEIQKSAIFDVNIAEEYVSEETASNGENVKIVKTRMKAATLEDMPAFKDSSGAFMLKDPQKIKINQGNGKTAEITLYGGDTLYDVSKKINDAIANDLGQGAYVDNLDNFCTISEGVSGTSESVFSSETVYGRTYLRDIDESSDTYGQIILNEYGVPQEISPADYSNYDEEELEALFSFRDSVETSKATLVIRSAVAGSAGSLTFTSENQDLVNALGLNTIQTGVDNVFTGSVYDAHTGKVIAENVESDGNSLNGIIHKNVRVEFDPMANTKAIWNEATKSYVLESDTQPYETAVHIHDRSTSFQIGQNYGEEIFINIGDMRAEALGLNSVDVSSRKNASDSIALLDAAIHKVGSQRSKIGAYQNELEYNANSLTQTSLHMQEAESRLKDADMATEYMEFIKLQILSNTGSSMLSQANQNSQAIMNILGM